MINILQVGVGPLGQKVVQYMVQRKGINIVGAVDPDPAKAGKDLGEFCVQKTLGITIEKTLVKALAGKKADAAVVTTLSDLEKVEPQIKELAAAGLHIVSTCEELACPWETRPDIAERIDKVCKKNAVACLGTGVNPGFLMDYLPAVLTSVCQHVDRITVIRVQDASKRRVPFQEKIGAGLNGDEFDVKKQEGTLRHVGLKESIHMIARALDWELDRIEESLEPVVANKRVSSGYRPVEKGSPRGVEQIARGFIAGREKITLHFRAAVGEEESFDKVEITGVPSFASVISGGVNGDIATAAITVNALRPILKAKPGLITMLDIPAPSHFL